MIKRKDILERAGDLISSERAKIYGDAQLNHERIAQLWSVILDQKLTVEQVYQCMIAVKMSRLILVKVYTFSIKMITMTNYL